MDSLQEIAYAVVGADEASIKSVGQAFRKEGHEQPGTPQAQAEALVHGQESLLSLEKISACLSWPSN